MMWTVIGMVYATIGAAAVLFALTFVTSLIGLLTTSMSVLIAGPIVDKVLGEKGR